MLVQQRITRGVVWRSCFLEDRSRIEIAEVREEADEHQLKKILLLLRLSSATCPGDSWVKIEGKLEVSLVDRIRNLQSLMARTRSNDFRGAHSCKNDTIDGAITAALILFSCATSHHTSCRSTSHALWRELA